MASAKRRRSLLSVSTVNESVALDKEGIPAVERFWSYVTRNGLWKTHKELDTDNSRCAVVEINAMELIEEDPTLADWVMQDPVGVQHRMKMFLIELKLVRDSDRVWIRLSMLPFRLKTVHEVLQEGRQGRFRLHVCGIITGVSPCAKRLYGHALKCPYCGKREWQTCIDGTQDAARCCSPQILDPSMDIDQPSTVMILVQRVTLCVLDVGNAEEMEKSDLRRCFQRVSLQCDLMDDLAGKFHLGDVIELFAMAQFTPRDKTKAAACHFGHPTDIRIWCIQAELVGQPWELLRAVRGRIACGEQEMGLEYVCAMMQKAVPYIHPPSLLIASLLSAVMIGASETDCVDKWQIHMLTVSHGRDPFLQTLLDRIARLLSPINAIDNIPATALAISDQSQSKTQETTAGFLTRRRQGIAILDLEILSKKNKNHCLEYITNGKPSGGSSPSPPTTTIWATGNASPSLRATTSIPGIVQQLGEDLVDAFDIIICYSVQNDSLYDQHVIDRVLGDDSSRYTAPHHDSSDCMAGDDESESDVQQYAMKQVTSILQRAAAAPKPRLSKEAKKLLQLYFTYVRNPSDFGEEPQARHVALRCFQSLIRLSSATARLTFSSVVRSVPDVILAIKFMEETLLEGGVFRHPSQLLMNLEGVSEHCPYPSLDAELSAMYEMVQKRLSVGNVGGAEE